MAEIGSSARLVHDVRWQRLFRCRAFFQTEIPVFMLVLILSLNIYFLDSRDGFQRKETPKNKKKQKL